MRYIVYGAGAIGGAVGGKLFDRGHDVTLIARGPHREAIAREGLSLGDPEGVRVLRIPVVGSPQEATLSAGDVVILSVKSQDTLAALQALVRACAAAPRVVCVQNGVENERAALRLVEDVYGVFVSLPSTHVVPGHVDLKCARPHGVLDLGRMPAGSDEGARHIAQDFTDAGFSSEVRDDIERWKYGKLLSALGGSVKALIGIAPATAGFTNQARQEAIACFEAAGIPYATDEEVERRRGVIPEHGGAEGAPGSAWQSLALGAASIETDYMNGEIVLLGRVHGRRTPVNAALQRLARRMSVERLAPGSLDASDLEREIGR